MIGQVVNYRYEILEKCGDGSFFSVFKARDKVLNRLVAVKVLVPQYAQNREFAERMISEEQAATELAHPNIARVIEADSQNGTYFSVVEYVRGVNLKDRIRRTAPFAISYAVDIAVAVSEALDYVHRMGKVHGDMRPHNILTSPEGQIKLTDFGTARALAAFPAIREATMLRSVHYMAPEVIRGESPMPASDVYSLGVVLYEMLTGSVPYDGATSAAIAAKQLQDEIPSPQARNAGVPTILNEIVMKAMHKDPAERYHNATEFIAALLKVKEWLRTGQSPNSWPMKEQAPAKNEPVYEADERSEASSKKAFMVVLPIFLILIITFTFLAYKVTSTKTIPVPDLVGKTIDQAQDMVKQSGLKIKTPYNEEYNDQYAAGQVFKMDPPPGSSVRESDPTVNVWVSKGPKKSTVPDVVGMASDKAVSKMIDAGFAVGQNTSEYSDSVPEGQVIRQSPKAGQDLQPGESIDIVVSKGLENPNQDNSKNSENSGSNNGSSDNGNHKEKGRQIDVSVSVPADASGPQDVKIVVIDDYGENTAYEEEHDPGDSFVHTVLGFGESIEIKVYVGGELISDEVH